jgi:hypothetical protein
MSTQEIIAEKIKINFNENNRFLIFTFLNYLYREIHTLVAISQVAEW